MDGSKRGTASFDCQVLSMFCTLMLLFFNLTVNSMHDRLCLFFKYIAAIWHTSGSLCVGLSLADNYQDDCQLSVTCRISCMFLSFFIFHYLKLKLPFRISIVLPCNVEKHFKKAGLLRKTSKEQII